MRRPLPVPLLRRLQGEPAAPYRRGAPQRLARAALGATAAGALLAR
jgi:hypothetical protein